MGTKRPWVKIGEGDDRVESWKDPFGEPATGISSLMLDAESYDLEIEWSVVLHGLRGFDGLARRGWRVDSVEDLLNGSNDVRVDDEQWGGETPGLSGVSMKVFVLRSRRHIVLRRLKCVLQRLLNYWHHQGYCVKVAGMEEEALRTRSAEAQTEIPARLAELD